MRKGSKITSLIFNLLVLVSVALGTVYLLVGLGGTPGLPNALSNPLSELVVNELCVIPWFMALASLIMVITQIVALAKKSVTLASFPVWFKFASLGGMWLLVGYNVVYLSVVNGLGHLLSLLTSYEGLTLIIIPFVLSLISFLFLERAHRISLGWFWTTLVIPLCFGASALALNYLAIVPSLSLHLSFLDVASYPLNTGLWASHPNWHYHAVILAIILGVCLVTGLLMLLIHNPRAKKFEEVKEKETAKKVEQQKIKKNEETAPVSCEKLVRVIKKTSGDQKVIHLSRLASGSWQVSYGNSGRVEVYVSQAEAIRAASLQAQQTGYSIRIHTK